jgi:hypothetical protein
MKLRAKTKGGIVTVRIDPDDSILDLEEAIGTFAECLERSNVQGAFDNYRFCVQNGRQVLLGHHTLISGRRDILKTSFAVSSRSSVNTVFVSKEARGPRHAQTWEELREVLKEGWLIGTRRYPGVKICFADNGRNFRREAERILVLP